METRGGIQSTTLAAGEGKDFGNPYRKASDAELAAYQANLEDLYDLFRAHVSEERGLSDAQVRALGAMVYSPRRAQEFGLVDEVADFDAAWLRWLNKPESARILPPSSARLAMFHGSVGSFRPWAVIPTDPTPQRQPRPQGSRSVTALSRLCSATSTPALTRAADSRFKLRRGALRLAANSTASHARA